MKRTILYVLVLALTCGLAGPAKALLIGVSSTPVSSLGDAAAIIAAPAFALNSVAFNTAQQGFNEAQNVLLLSDLSVDGGIILAGTRVNSHMIFLNKEDNTSSFSHFGVKWLFNNQILGVMSATDGSLEFASTAVLGASGTTYPSPPFALRGLEGNNGTGLGGDGYKVDGNILTLGMQIGQPGDWVRVVTAVPEPSTVILLGLGMLGLGVISRRRSQKDK